MARRAMQWCRRGVGIGCAAQVGTGKEKGDRRRRDWNEHYKMVQCSGAYTVRG